MNFPFLPTRASTFAVEVDQIMLVITLLALFFTLLVYFLVVFFAIRYRRGSRADRSNPLHHSIALELTWSIIPLILALGIFAWTVVPFSKIYNPPKNAEEIFVIGKRWMWHIQHTNGIRENNELHITTGKPYKITLISQDVIHGFFIPDFRIKRDALPGRYNTVWFQATRPGKYHLFCSEYCGTNHSEMAGWVYVMPPAQYSQWLKTGAQGAAVDVPQTPQQSGAQLFTQLSCGNCHTNEDSVRAPSLVGLYGRQRTMLSGSKQIADDEYLRGAIRRPQDHLLQGYGQVSTMPAYTEVQLTEDQIHDLIVYVKSLGAGPALPAATLLGQSSAEADAPRRKPVSTNPIGNPAAPAATTGNASAIGNPANSTTHEALPQNARPGSSTGNHR